MGRYLDIIRQVEEAAKPVDPHKDAVQKPSQTSDSPSVQPGNRITWQGADGKDRSGVVDFLHTDADGTLWAFCTCPDGGWVAVNTKYATKKEDLHA
jgi:hypothetical protein